MSRRLFTAVVLSSVLLTTLPGCGYNTLQAQDQDVQASWSEVLNQYQRRADLVPNLVNVVKGYAAHEQKVLIDVTQARASVAGIKATPELVNDPVAFQKFIDAQNQLQGSLSRLMVVTENYPDLKANQNFMDLSASIEGTENRIAVARNRYIHSVQSYNSTVVQFPSNLTAKAVGMKVKPNFSVGNEAQISQAPTVNFSGS
jgi:LemA protein